MKRTVIAGLALLTALAWAAAEKKADTPEALLGAAIHQEEAEGNLEAAIAAYKKFLTQHASNRALAAQAQFRIGVCYEKVGNAEARKAYEKVLSDYTDQQEIAAQARRRLAALEPHVSGNHATAMATRRVWAGPDVHALGGLSPDGRYLSCVDWTTGDLALRDLATRKTRRLTNESPAQGFSVISPDGKEVAYAPGLAKGELRVIGLDGSASRILYSNKGVFPLPFDWSPDGKYILTLLYKSQVSIQIALVSVADGSVRTLKTQAWWWPEKMKFSPDGRYIAYDFPQQQGSDNRDISLLAADGGREIPLVEHPADDQLLGWTPDGNNILFASDRSGSMSVWMIRLTDGKPQGSPELVKQDIGQAHAIGFTRAGSLYYGLLISTSDIYTAEFDPEAGRVLTQPQKATQRYVGSNLAPAWSPDGQYLAYISDRRPGFWGFLRHRPEVISIRSLKTGEERDLSHNLLFIDGPMQWFPDGRSILVAGKDRKIQHGLYRIDAQTGEVTPIVVDEPGSHVFFASPALLPDGKRLAYIRGDWEAKKEIIVMRDLETGREKELFRSAPPLQIGGIALLPDGKRLLYGGDEAEKEIFVMRDLETGREKELFRSAPPLQIIGGALSPDGRQLALTLLEKETRSTVLKVLPVAGGDASELVRAKEPETIVGGRGFGVSVTWTSDSRYVVFGRVRHASQDTKTEVFAVPAGGGEAHALGVAMDGVRGISFQSDGRRVAFAAGQLPAVKTEVWVMENFLPTLKAARPR